MTNEMKAIQAKIDELTNALQNARGTEIARTWGENDFYELTTMQGIQKAQDAGEDAVFAFAKAWIARAEKMLGLVEEVSEESAIEELTAIADSARSLWTPVSDQVRRDAALAAQMVKRMIDAYAAPKEERDALEVEAADLLAAIKAGTATATRDDARYVDSDDHRAQYRAWVNGSDMGGWIGSDLEAFEQAIESELRYALTDEQAEGSITLVEITKVEQAA